MEVRTRRRRFLSMLFSIGVCILLAFFLQVMFQPSTVSSKTIIKSDFFPESNTQKKERDASKAQRRLHTCEGCNKEKDVSITTTYLDASGAIQMQNLRSKDLSASWVWQKSDAHAHEEKRNNTGEASSNDREVTDKNSQSYRDEHKKTKMLSPEQFQRLRLLQKRREHRTIDLTQVSSDSQEVMETAAIKRAKQFDFTLSRRYNPWRKEYEKVPSDSTLRIMKDQVIMARVYASIASSKKQTKLYNSLMKHIKDIRHAIGEANSDSELQNGAMEQAKSMGHVLSSAKDNLYDCAVVVRKLRAMVHSIEEVVDANKKKGTFLTHMAARVIPKPLHCLALHLTSDYYLNHYNNVSDLSSAAKLEDPDLYHYAIFSDNVVATSVVINSTIINTSEPEKHVFHIVTNKLNFAAMKMWFSVHRSHGSTVHVENIDSFKWLNSSYCPVVRQLESEGLKEYYFKTNQPSLLSTGEDNLKYKNPKYLSILNHLRFYLPELYPKLDKILFLDDDVVVQKDLTPLWSIDMKGMVNGAVENCKVNFHQYKHYLNFSNPKISVNFDPEACGWAFGMNMFDLKEWRKRNLTGVYHYWQNMNDERQLWQLGTLPAGLLTFYDTTHVLDENWHVLGLGYNGHLNLSKIENAAVIHYNGNYKPWLDLAIIKYRKYWSKFVMLDNPYLQYCHIYESF